MLANNLMRLDERKGVLQEINGMQDLKVRAVDQLLDQARDHDKGQGYMKPENLSWTHNISGGLQHNPGSTSENKTALPGQTNTGHTLPWTMPEAITAAVLVNGHHPAAGHTNGSGSEEVEHDLAGLQQSVMVKQEKTSVDVDDAAAIGHENMVAAAYSGEAMSAVKTEAPPPSVAADGGQVSDPPLSGHTVQYAQYNVSAGRTSTLYNLQPSKQSNHHQPASPYSPALSSNAPASPFSHSLSTNAPPASPYNTSLSTNVPPASPYNPSLGSNAPPASPYNPSLSSNAPPASPYNPSLSSNAPPPSPYNPALSSNVPPASPYNASLISNAPPASPYNPSLSSNAPPASPYHQPSTAVVQPSSPFSQPPSSPYHQASTAIVQPASPAPYIQPVSASSQQLPFQRSHASAIQPPPAQALYRHQLPVTATKSRVQQSSAAGTTFHRPQTSLLPPSSSAFQHQTQQPSAAAAALSVQSPFQQLYQPTTQQQLFQSYPTYDLNSSYLTQPLNQRSSSSSVEYTASSINSMLSKLEPIKQEAPDRTTFSTIINSITEGLKTEPEEAQVYLDLKSGPPTIPSVYQPAFPTVSNYPRVQEINFQCYQCNFSTDTAESLSLHMTLQHPTTTELPRALPGGVEGLDLTRPKLACTACDFVGSSKRGLTSHIKLHHPHLLVVKQRKSKMRADLVRKHPCDMCDFRAVRGDHLTRHKRQKHSGVVYSCTHCPFSTHREYFLIIHKRKEHKLDIPYNNTRVPSEPGVYRCNACDFVADNASDLNRHRQKVHNDTRHKCAECDFTAKRLEHVKRHVKIKHEGIRYPCNICEYAATRPSYLKKHRERVHKVM